MSKAKTATSIAAITLCSSAVDSTASRALALQRVAERVDLVHHEIERARSAGAGAPRIE